MSHQPINLVTKVLTPIQPEEVKFSRNTLVTDGKNYGFVSQTNSRSSTPIQITWWESNSNVIAEKMWYSWETMKGLNIQQLDLFIPEKTWIKIAANTLIELNTGKLCLFKQDEIFWLKAIDERGYQLVNQASCYIFSSVNFPGIPFACVNELPSPEQLEKARSLSQVDLKIRANLWLSLNSPADFVKQLKVAPESLNDQLYQNFCNSDYLQGENFQETELNLAWNQALSEYIEEQKCAEGWQGFKVGDRLVQSTPKVSFKRSLKGKQTSYDYRFGKIIDLDLSPSQPQPIVVVWQGSDIREHYSPYTLEKENISPILPLVRLSPQVSYEVSEDGKYYRAFIGFNSKKIARSWLKELKRELGYLDNLVQFPLEQRPTSQKYHYIASHPQVKNLAKRRQKLVKIASWDLRSART